MFTHNKNIPWYTDTTSVAQTRRAMKRHHGVGGNYSLTELYRRNLKILAEYQSGKSQRAAIQIWDFTAFSEVP